MTVLINLEELDNFNYAVEELGVEMARESPPDSDVLETLGEIVEEFLLGDDFDRDEDLPGIAWNFDEQADEEFDEFVTPGLVEEAVDALMEQYGEELEEIGIEEEDFLDSIRSNMVKGFSSFNELNSRDLLVPLEEMDSMDEFGNERIIL